jgi:methionyl-tRNA formyltransferase
VAPVRTVFLGSGAFALPALTRLAAHPDIELVGVVTAPPRPAGRDAAPARTPVHARASELGLGPVLTPERLRAPEGILAVQERDPDLLVLADYGRLVPEALLEPRHGALNLHPSLLPRHRGAAPIPAAILAGDRVTGVTLMRMDPGMDTGPIIAQRRWALDGDETAPELEALLADEAALLLGDMLGPWLAGDLTAVPQSTEGATVTRPLRRADGRLDPGRPAAELERQVRALAPWPGTFLETDQGRLIVRAAGVAPAPDPPHVRAGASAMPARPAAPGTLDEVGLVTAEGRLALREVQPAGGRPMSWTDYRRGRPATRVIP